MSVLNCSSGHIFGRPMEAAPPESFGPQASMVQGLKAACQATYFPGTAEPMP